MRLGSFETLELVLLLQRGGLWRSMNQVGYQTRLVIAQANQQKDTSKKSKKDKKNATAGAGTGRLPKREAQCANGRMGQEGILSHDRRAAYCNREQATVPTSLWIRQGHYWTREKASRFQADVAEELFIKDKPDAKYTADDLPELAKVVKNRTAHAPAFLCPGRQGGARSCLTARSLYHSLFNPTAKASFTYPTQYEVIRKITKAIHEDRDKTAPATVTPAASKAPGAKKTRSSSTKGSAAAEESEDEVVITVGDSPADSAPADKLANAFYSIADSVIHR
ncbi:hypothetical protein B0H14DRAFT_2560409 [Mycena olivaceomarginata]|nr:hypothetical protein B0H14DRAFT_2632246 [Mycena olivaceomarginata]KAJ7892028.1 hypothetical protein B0H14DRAFT_2560409 [Mycena olivaceomarginata]